MNIKVRILSQANNERGVEIPLSSVFENGGRRYVWVVNPSDSTIKATEITTGGSGENGVVNVVSGITANDLIIRTGVRHLVNGEKVNMLQSESDTNPGICCNGKVSSVFCQATDSFLVAYDRYHFLWSVQLSSDA